MLRLLVYLAVIVSVLAGRQEALADNRKEGKEPVCLPLQPRLERLANQHNRVSGSWSDIGKAILGVPGVVAGISPAGRFRYAGDAKTLSVFLKDCGALVRDEPVSRDKLLAPILHAGRPLLKEGEAYDWEMHWAIRVQEPKVSGAKDWRHFYVVTRIDASLGGNVKLDELKVPTEIEAKSDGEAEKPIAKHEARRKDAKADPMPWGRAVEGVQCRLRPPRGVFRHGDFLDFGVELRNTGPKQWTRIIDPPSYHIELDGEWFHWIGQTSDDPPPRAAVAKQSQQLSVCTSWAWRAASGDWPGDWLGAPDPGKHVVRVAFCLYPRDAEERSIRVVSNPVSVEIVAGQDPAPRQAWGQPAEGVQLRLRAEKKAWPADAVTTLKLDARNWGKRDLRFSRAEQMYEIQLDGQWYTWAHSPSARSSWFCPGMSYYDVAVSLGKTWKNKEDGKLLTLRPGKHTVRVACKALPLDAMAPKTGGPVRAISNPVVVKIVRAQPAADPPRTAGSFGEGQVPTPGLEGK